MVELDISKVLPGGASGPKATFREDPDLKKAKIVGLIFTLIALGVVIIATVAFYLISNSYKATDNTKAETLNGVVTRVAKYKKAERQAKQIDVLSRAVQETIIARPKWSSLLTEIAKNTPRSIVYTSFSAGDQSAEALAEAALGFAKGSLSGTPENAIQMIGADNFLNLTKIKVDKTIKSWDSLVEEKKISSLIAEMKKGDIWDADNVSAVKRMDSRLRLPDGSLQNYFSAKLDIANISALISKNLGTENKLKIDGRAGSYTDLAELLAALKKVDFISNPQISNASMRILDTGDTMVDFSIEVNLTKDVRTIEGSQSTVSIVTEAPSVPKPVSNGTKSNDASTKNNTPSPKEVK